MDVLFPFRNAFFVWNEDKAQSNAIKHGVSFYTACEVFFDPLLQFVDATREDEQREAAVGESLDGKHLFVVHVVKTPDLIRIISAWEITAKEKKRYENNE